MYAAGRLIENDGWHWGDDPCSPEVTDDLWTPANEEPDPGDTVTVIDGYALWGRESTNNYLSLCECKLSANFI